MTQEQSIIEAFQAHAGAMTLGQMLKYSWGYEFRARKAELNSDPSSEWMIRFVKKGYEKKSDHLYILERKPKQGDLL